MTDWQTSQGHLIFLKEFRKPRKIDEVPAQADWKPMLGEEPEVAIQRFLDSGVLVSVGLSERVSCKFKVRELKEMLKNYGLAVSGNKQTLIQRLIETHAEDMERAVVDLTVLKCSEKGEEIIERFLATKGEPPVRDDTFLPDKTEKVSGKVSEKADEGTIGGEMYGASKKQAEAEIPEAGLVTELPRSFRNPHEYDAEYILIPGGDYSYQGKIRKKVSDIYFAKYSVTNKLYHRFIRYLEEKERGLLDILPRSEFDRRMIEFASGIKGFTEFLGDESKDWSMKLLPLSYRHKPLAGKDHPVTYVSWFASQSYCCWLSALEAVNRNSVWGQTGGLYRLPTEMEWEWAAGGGGREYPWSSEKGPPTDKLANYGRTVWTTTRVGQYPEGATPEGLMDMAGNVWEWVEDWYDGHEDTRSLRGGSWSNLQDYMRCSYRSRFSPVYRLGDVGFRVVYSRS